MEIPNYDDDNFLKQLIECDHKAFDDFYNEVRSRAIGYVWKLLKDNDQRQSKEIVDNALTKLWDILVNKKATFKSYLRLEAYFFVIVRRLAFDEYKRNKRTKILPIGEKVESIPADDPQQAAVDLELAYKYDIFKKAFSKMGDSKAKEVIDLIINRNMTVDQIMDHLDITKDVYYKRKQRGLERLATIVKEFIAMYQIGVILFLRLLIWEFFSVQF